MPLNHQFIFLKTKQFPVVWWLAPLPHSKRVPGLTPGWGLSVWSLYVLPVYAWVLSGYSGFLPLSKNMDVRLIGDSKIVLRSDCEHVCGCLSRLSLCGPVMDWRPVQGVPRLSPNDRWDRLQPPRDPTDGLSGYRKWMDGWKTVSKRESTIYKLRDYGSQSYKTVSQYCKGKYIRKWLQ